ncbi:MAG: 23S rRNA (adenine(2503)-C(2))-methyltransferase RlmN [Proteobacteria bacterium]|nr:23S rRNA (adenine(2503)-C(2))-methyltransferase RlmN [Pseudomonadota bacterium]
MSEAPTNLLDLDLDGLKSLLKELGQPAFRAKQLHSWIYERGVSSFDDMSNLPKDLRAKLAERTTLGALSTVVGQTSKDGTHKRLYRLADGPLIESVLMPYNDGRRTACISSQAGCAMGCVFCATGQMGFQRNLTEAEIYEQAWRFHTELKDKGERLSNVVMMGMGEPFHNYDNTIAAVRRMMSELGIGARRITISTVGLVPAIQRFAKEGLQVGLAISLHAATNDIRSALMPVNRKYDLQELVGACHAYVEATGRRVTFEWALIAGENDSAREAHRVGRLLKGLNCHVNLIPLNPTASYEGEPTNDVNAAIFVETLGMHHISATVRVRRGIDIDAGCGQLRDRVEEVQPSS